ncbi:MAG: YggS family pyridoxal phosphate-dependent enzyme [Acidobacteria bacterium]|nr:MAG: YggS family pyridoxal phosphate-dependent enzyme [Acidobacteriota bacterium]
MSIADNVAQIQKRITAAAGRVARNPQEVALMAVTKTVAPEPIREAYAAGLRLFGENRVQEFAVKAQALRDLRDPEWHMIGHLQGNKAAKAVELFSGIDSVDSVRLAQKLNAAAQVSGRKLSVLLEINIGGEQAKSGLDPDSPELEQLLSAAPELDHLRMSGLMTVPPFSENPEETRPYFRRLRELRDRVKERNLSAVSLHTLSMGMSHDFEVAIEEGSTCVRIGTAIFGERRRA